MKLLFSLVILCLISISSHAREAIVDCEKERTDYRLCIACNVYHEARGEPLKGQILVALVVMNRVESNLYKSTECDVVWEQHNGVAEFSWTRDGKSDKVYELRGWRMAMAITAQIMMDKQPTFIEGETRNILWFHADYVSPRWAKQKEFVIKIGRHLFYR